MADAKDAPEPRAGSKRKLARKSLTLREKAIAKSFCEQKVNDCKARGELAPSQEVLRKEVATQFGWAVGRSTLSKIISMDWRLLRNGQEGGDAPRNPDMKRRRRPLFPAFEADLVKFIAAHLGEEDLRKFTGANEAAKVDIPLKTTGRVLTEALILEEAQRLKQVHNVSDEMLVLSVGWLARFKHRHCIRLRKPAGANKVAQPPQPEFAQTKSEAPVAWNIALLGGNLAQTQAASEYSIVDNSIDTENPSEPVSLAEYASMIPLKAALCSAQWCQDRTAKPTATAIREHLPCGIRAMACSCQGSATDADLIGGIDGLRVAVVGFGSVAKAFLAAAEVGASGFVTCVEASPASVYLAEQAAESYCLETLELPLVNMKFIVGEYGGMLQSTSPSTGLGGDGLKNYLGQADLVICNCSIQSLEFPASKHAMLELAFSLLKVGGELRVTDLICSRRLSSAECEEARFAVESAGTDGSGTDEGLKQFEQKLLLGAPYLGDLQRLYRALGSDVDVRTVSCNAEEAVAIDTAVVSLLPSLSAAGDVRFRRVTFHVYRLEDVENPREDYGQTAIFKGDDSKDKTGGAPDSSLMYRLDDEWTFRRDVCTPIDGNTAQILQSTWIQRYFSVSGDRSRHRGPFVPSSSSSLPVAPSVSEGTLHSSEVDDASVSGQFPSTTSSSSEPLEMVDI